MIPVSKLPGTEANAAGTLFPQGHASGDMKFSGDGVKVTGLMGSATLSMPLANYSQGWSGSIYQWLNENWVKIPTTVSQSEESSDGIASATIFSDGIYALIVSYKQPTEEGGRCKSFDFVGLGGNYDPPFGMIYTEAVIIGKFDISSLAEKTFTYRVISLDPSIAFGGEASGIVYVASFHDMGDGTVAILLDFPDGEAYVTHDGETSSPPFIFRVNIDGCKVDYVITGEGA
jgi:hypothetical protein